LNYYAADQSHLVRSLPPFLCTSLLHLIFLLSFSQRGSGPSLFARTPTHLVCTDLKWLDWCKQYGDCSTLPSLRPYCFCLSFSLLFEYLDESNMVLWRARVSYPHIVYRNIYIVFEQERETVQDLGVEVEPSQKRRS
jgi:hypothetical protein